jgi:hypothetical protein
MDAPPLTPPCAALSGVLKRLRTALESGTPAEIEECAGPLEEATRRMHEAGHLQPAVLRRLHPEILACRRLVSSLGAFVAGWAELRGAGVCQYGPGGVWKFDADRESQGCGKAVEA